MAKTSNPERAKELLQTLAFVEKSLADGNTSTNVDQLVEDVKKLRLELKKRYHDAFQNSRLEANSAFFELMSTLQNMIQFGELCGEDTSNCERSLANINKVRKGMGLGNLFNNGNAGTPAPQALAAPDQSLVKDISLIQSKMDDLINKSEKKG